MNLPTLSERSRQRLKRAGTRALDGVEPLIALGLGLGFGIAGLAGAVKGDKLAAATLGVLAVVAISLFRERWLRADANRKIEILGRQQEETIAAVNAIGSGNPYSVLAHETTWDIVEPDGSLAVATRIKKIRFDQNKVFSLTDYATGEGTRDIEYSPGEALTKFLAEGNEYALISLGRMYYRGDHLNFKVTRTSHNAFMKPTEAVKVLVRDATDLMRLTIRWPAEREPSAIRLGRATATQDWHSADVLQNLETKNGRPTYTVEIRSPEKGSTATIEWEW